MDRQSQLTVTHHVEHAWINEILHISNKYTNRIPSKEPVVNRFIKGTDICHAYL